MAEHHAIAHGAIDLQRKASLADSLFIKPGALSLTHRYADGLVQDLTRVLIPVSYTIRGPYEQDPAWGYARSPDLG